MDIVTYVKNAVALLTAEIDDAEKGARTALEDHAAANDRVIAELRARIAALESAVGDTSQLGPLPSQGNGAAPAEFKSRPEDQPNH